MGLRDSLEDLLVAVGGKRITGSIDDLVEEIAIAVNPSASIRLVDFTKSMYTAGFKNYPDISDVQRDIHVIGDEISGRLLYLIKPIFNNKELEDGYYLWIYIKISEKYVDGTLNATIEWKLSDEKTWNSLSSSRIDGISTFVKVTNNKKQKLHLRITTENYSVFERIFHLNNLEF